MILDTCTMAGTFEELIFVALPKDLRPGELLKEVPPALRKQDPDEALRTALRSSHRINWQAYSARNPDVKGACLDPWEHFITKGIHEGRKLVSWHPLKEEEVEDAPLISVIIVCNNNECHLGKCLESAIAQTLSDLEIIFVDDASVDGSLVLAEKYRERDKRIRILRNDRNEGTFLSRKKGIMAAKGRYITFVDADDFLDSTACEILYGEIVKGYDIVDAGAVVVNTTKADERDIDYFRRYRNIEQDALFEGKDLPWKIFVEKVIPWNIWGKLYLREICAAAYSELEDGFFIRCEDKYGMMAIARYARNIKRIVANIYYYNFGIGFSTSKDLKNTYKKWMTLGDTTKVLESYVRTHALDVDIYRIKNEHFCIAFHRWLAGVPANEARLYFERMKEQFGLECMLANLVDNFQNQQEKIADKFQHCVDAGPQSRVTDKIPRKIGFYYHRLTRGAVQSITIGLAGFLVSKGFEIVFFCEERNREELELPEGATVVYVGTGLGGNEKTKRHLREFNRALSGKPVDLMFYATTLVPYMLWDLVLLDHHAIPVIGCYHNDHNWAYINTDANYPHHAQEAAMRCLAVLTCLSLPSELYFRLLGINACYIPNPVAQMPEREWTGAVPQKIAVIGRLGDPIKQVGQSLQILKKINETLPHVKMLLVGDFMNKAQTKECRQKIRELGLDGKAIICGRTDSPNDFLKQCGVLLSTSFTEGFPMAIAEAQALGIPCVVYDVPIELARNNQAIIKVAQNDIAAAAGAIAAILNNKEEWRKLSGMARRIVAPYSPENYHTRMWELINNYKTGSCWRSYNDEDYAGAIKSAGFYAGRQRPARWY